VRVLVSASIAASDAVNSHAMPGSLKLTLPSPMSTYHYDIRSGSAENHSQNAPSTFRDATPCAGQTRDVRTGLGARRMHDGFLYPSRSDGTFRHAVTGVLGQDQRHRLGSRSGCRRRHHVRRRGRGRYAGIRCSTAGPPAQRSPHLSRCTAIRSKRSASSNSSSPISRNRDCRANCLISSAL
jgi:hypothetical protein